MNHLLLNIFFLLILFQSSFAQNQPKYEFRGAWIATVSNIDWPSKPGLTAFEQQQEFINRLDQLRSVGCNAVIVQIRPASDAFYESPFEPWSRFLTGRQGQAPFPFYDPLNFMIQETHKRHMEFHAWVNPFRALTNSAQNPNPSNHFTKTNPNWLVSYGGKSYINPGIPDARSYVTKVLLDIVERYDIDALHIDDYFYPYRIAGQEFGDQATFLKYGHDFDNKDDWRRNNVNLFVSTLNHNLKKIKPHVKLGISPFGVWRNQSKDPMGSPTRGGQTTYDDLYADVLLWMRKGWIDYLLPQLYWERGHKAAPFEVLLPWWEKYKYERHVYYGLGLYRMLQATKYPWNSPNEILGQITDIRNEANQSGYAFYSASNFNKIPMSIQDSLKKKYSNIDAFPPRMPWIDSVAPKFPQNVVAKKDPKGVKLMWQRPLGEQPFKYAIYRLPLNHNEGIKTNEYLIALVSKDEFEYVDHHNDNPTAYKYVVTSLDRLWNESKESFAQLN